MDLARDALARHASISQHMRQAIQREIGEEAGQRKQRDRDEAGEGKGKEEPIESILQQRGAFSFLSSTAPMRSFVLLYCLSTTIVLLVIGAMHFDSLRVSHCELQQ